MRKAVTTDTASKGDGPYSQAIISNGFVYVSGQGPLTPGTNQIVGSEVKEQAAVTLQNIKLILEAAGCSMDDVVKVNVYLASMKDFAAFNEVYVQYFSAPMPARSCVGAELDDILVEIDAIAEIPTNGN
ncbi:Rid family detoxifying hydrolase [Paenibacillus koleovorans]|uniref:Rid family detoxifying hydrolase n=1 Tax=Paenibacillus koleovorans TaxID=121608 RepID=UPI000FD6DC49|nr:Rid family detoxifying hydrolase [Paenibacillus koleovorans]